MVLYRSMHVILSRFKSSLIVCCCLLSAQTDMSVVTLFCTQEHGLLLQDCYPKPSGLQALLALDVPYYCFSCKVRTLCSARVLSLQRGV